MNDVIRFRMGHPVGVAVERIVTAADMKKDTTRKLLLIEARRLGGDAVLQAFVPLPIDRLSRAVADLRIAKIKSTQKASTNQGVRKMAFSAETQKLVQQAVATGVPFPEEFKAWLSRLPDDSATTVLNALIDAAGDSEGAAQGLSEREMAKCKARGVDPAKYAANKAVMMGGK